MDELGKALYSASIIELLNTRISTFIPEVKDHLAIKNVILMAHNTIEGILNLLLSRYYLGKEMEKSDKDKVNHFWINILTEMNFMSKIKILRETTQLENNIINKFCMINEIRNDVAHYPHREYKRKEKHLLYNGKHIFEDSEALRSFYEDFDVILTETNKCIAK